VCATRLAHAGVREEYENVFVIEVNKPSR